MRSALTSSLIPELAQADLSALNLIQKTYSSTKLGAKAKRQAVFLGFANHRTEFFRLCETRKWNYSRLLLALPHAKTSKGSVTLLNYSGRYRILSILKWVQNSIGSNIQRFDRGTALRKWFQTSCVTDVCLLLVSTLTLPPFFFSALTVKYTGRINFATAAPDAARSGLPTSTISLNENTVNNNRSSRNNGRYLLFSPQGEFAYGETRSLVERMNFSRFCSVLRWIVPDLSDILMCSLALVNLCAVASIFDLKGSPIQAMVHFGWTVVKYNFILLFGWILILNLANKEPFIAIGRFLISVYRYLSLTGLGRIVTGDLQWLSHHIYSLIATFFGFNMIVHYLRRKFWPHTLEEPEPWSEWLRFQRPIVVLNPGRPTIFRSRSPEFQPRVRALIRQLKLSEYTVSSSLKFDFLFQLPIWQAGNTPEAYRNPNDIQDSWNGPVCFRCRCVKALKMQSLSRRLEKRPCGRCGYAGFRTFCAICLDSYTESDQVCGLPCGHSYHKNCVLSWLLSDPHQTCPCCRWPAYVDKIYENQA